MIVTWEGGDNFIIKTKNKTAHIGENITLGELKINTPGEYETGGVQLEIIDGTIELFSEKMTVAWIKKSKILTDEELEKINGIDVLLIGIGGGEFCETKTALDLINQIDPKIVIPMYSGKLPEDKSSLDSFIKEEGTQSEPQDQFKFTESDLPAEERKIIILKPSS